VVFDATHRSRQQISSPQQNSDLPASQPSYCTLAAVLHSSGSTLKRFRWLDVQKLSILEYPASSTMANINWRTINVDAYDPESALNFPLETLLPANLPAPSNSAESAQIAQQVRQLLRAGDSLGALQSALETAPLAGDEAAKQIHLTTVLEVLQGIRQSDVSRILGEMLKQPGGAALGDTLMKYIYKGMATGAGGSGSRGMSPQSTGIDGAGRGFSQIQARNFGEGGGGQVMSVLLSWHEKLVEVVGVGGIVRVMSDRRTV